MTDLENDEVLLLSGGLDSTALAAIRRPKLTLFIDYGQRPALGEGRAAAAVAGSLKLDHLAIEINMAPIGGGLLADETPLSNAPSPEWWPYRNQLLCTIGAAVALRQNLPAVVIGSVRGDGDRHIDGTPEFYRRLDSVTSLQEGEVGVIAPALERSTEELVRESGLGMETLGWTLSCHRSATPCHACPGCNKREGVLVALGLVADRST